MCRTPSATARRSSAFLFDGGFARFGFADERRSVVGDDRGKAFPTARFGTVRAGEGPFFVEGGIDAVRAGRSGRSAGRRGGRRPDFALRGSAAAAGRVLAMSFRLRLALVVFEGRTDVWAVLGVDGAGGLVCMNAGCERVCPSPVCARSRSVYVRLSPDSVRLRSGLAAVGVRTGLSADAERERHECHYARRKQSSAGAGEICGEGRVGHRGGLPRDGRRISGL